MTTKRLPIAVQNEARALVLDEVLKHLVDADPTVFEQVERISNTVVVVRTPIADVTMTFTAKHERMDIDFEVEEYQNKLADDEAKAQKKIAEALEKAAKAQARAEAKAAKAKEKAEEVEVEFEVEIE